jgi:transcription antitermination factor NusG
MSTFRSPASAATSLVDESRWYACYTRAHHEKKVDRLLTRGGVESFLPLVQRLSRWTDRTKSTTVPLFPSYVFARFSMERLFHVLGVPGVTSVVRNDGRLVAVPDEEVTNIRRFAESLKGSRIESRIVSLPPRGTPVRFIGGPFKGVSGTVVDHRNHSRVLVGLAAIGWGVQVDVDASFVRTDPGCVGAGRERDEELGRVARKAVGTAPVGNSR